MKFWKGIPEEANFTRSLYSVLPRKWIFWIVDSLVHSSGTKNLFSFQLWFQWIVSIEEMIHPQIEQWKLKVNGLGLVLFLDFDFTYRWLDFVDLLEFLHLLQELFLNVLGKPRSPAFNSTKQHDDFLESQNGEGNPSFQTLGPNLEHCTTPSIGLWERLRSMFKNDWLDSQNTSQYWIVQWDNAENLIKFYPNLVRLCCRMKGFQDCLLFQAMSASSVSLAWGKRLDYSKHPPTRLFT